MHRRRAALRHGRRRILPPPGQRRVVEAVPARRIDRPGGGRQHEAAHAPRVPQGELDHGPAPHRLPDQVGSLDRQVVEQGRHVVRVPFRLDRASVHRRRREAAMREAHAGVGGREVRHLLPPGHVAAPQAVREHDRRPLPADLVMDVGAVDAQAPGGPCARGAGRWCHGRSGRQVRWRGGRHHAATGPPSPSTTSSKACKDGRPPVWMKSTRSPGANSPARARPIRPAMILPV